jgi:hypothetical protein
VQEDERTERFLMRITRASNAQAAVALDSRSAPADLKGMQVSLSIDGDNSQLPNSNSCSGWRRTTQEEIDARCTFACFGHIPALTDSPDPADSCVQAPTSNAVSQLTETSTSQQLDVLMRAADASAAPPHLRPANEVMDHTLSCAQHALPSSRSSPKSAIESGTVLIDVQSMELRCHPLDYEDNITPTQLEDVCMSFPADSEAQPTAIEEAAGLDTFVDTCDSHAVCCSDKALENMQQCDGLKVSTRIATGTRENSRPTGAPSPPTAKLGTQLGAMQHTDAGSSFEVKDSVNGIGGASFGVLLHSCPETCSGADVVNCATTAAAATAVGAPVSVRHGAGACALKAMLDSENDKGFGVPEASGMALAGFAGGCTALDAQEVASGVVLAVPSSSRHATVTEKAPVDRTYAPITSPATPQDDGHTMQAVSTAAVSVSAVNKVTNFVGVIQDRMVATQTTVDGPAAVQAIHVGDQMGSHTCRATCGQQGADLQIAPVKGAGVALAVTQTKNDQAFAWSREEAHTIPTQVMSDMPGAAEKVSKEVLGMCSVSAKRCTTPAVKLPCTTTELTSSSGPQITQSDARAVRAAAQHAAVVNSQGSVPTKALTCGSPASALSTPVHDVPASPEPGPLPPPVLLPAALDAKPDDVTACPQGTAAHLRSGPSSPACRFNNAHAVPSTPLPSRANCSAPTQCIRVAAITSPPAASDRSFSANKQLQVEAARRIAAHLSTQDEEHLASASSTDPKLHMLHATLTSPVAEARKVAAHLSTQAARDIAFFSQCTVQESPSQTPCCPAVASEGVEWALGAGALIATVRDSQPSSSSKSPPRAPERSAVACENSSIGVVSSHGARKQPCSEYRGATQMQGGDAASPSTSPPGEGGAVAAESTGGMLAEKARECERTEGTPTLCEGSLGAVAARCLAEEASCGHTHNHRGHSGVPQECVLFSNAEDVASGIPQDYAACPANGRAALPALSLQGCAVAPVRDAAEAKGVEVESGSPEVSVVESPGSVCHEDDDRAQQLSKSGVGQAIGVSEREAPAPTQNVGIKVARSPRGYVASAEKIADGSSEEAEVTAQQAVGLIPSCEGGNEGGIGVSILTGVKHANGAFGCTGAPPCRGIAERAAAGSPGTVQESESYHKGPLDGESQGVSSKAPANAAVAVAGDAWAAAVVQSVWTVPETVTQGGQRRDDGDPSQKVCPLPCIICLFERQPILFGCLP